MADFVCKLGTSTGQVIERVYTSSSEDDLRRDFESQDYLVFSIRRKAAAASLQQALVLDPQHLLCRQLLGQIEVAQQGGTAAWR